MVISIEYDKIARHENHKDLKNIYFDSLHFILTQAIFLKHGNFIDPRHPRQNFNPRHSRQNFMDPRHPRQNFTDPRHPRQSLAHATHEPTPSTLLTPPALFSRLQRESEKLALLWEKNNFLLSSESRRHHWMNLIVYGQIVFGRT